MTIYEIVSNKFIELLEKGVCPWSKPWSPVGGGRTCAINYTTRKPYSMLNQMFLMHNGEYLSMSEVRKYKGKVKKGEKAEIVVGTFIKWRNEDGTEDTKSHEGEEGWKKVFNHKFYNVFHISQCEGIQSKIKEEPKPKEPTLKPIDDAENVITDYIQREGIGFHRTMESNSAFYAPLEDKVVVPCLEQYKEIAEYYSTIFHELGHSTGHEKRLARSGIVKFDGFGSNNYSKEELIAELTAAFILASLGIDSTKAFNNSAAYLQNWMKAIKENTQMIVWASQGAEKAAKFIMNNAK